MSAAAGPLGAADRPSEADRAGEAAARVEALAARLLTWGTRLALSLVLAGVVGMLGSGIDPITAASPSFSIASIPASLLALRPEGFLWAGLTLVVALPLGRVVISGAGFLAAGDRRQTLIAALVLLVIGVSIVAALGLGG